MGVMSQGGGGGKWGVSNGWGSGGNVVAGIEMFTGSGLGHATRVALLLY